MKPAFALKLDHDRITLLHRSGHGWARVGAAAVDDPGFNAALARLRGAAQELEPDGVSCKLILPSSQILYREIEAPGPDPRSRRQQIRAALEGVTPYGVDELVFDWSGTGQTVQVAVVARETLDEAEEFAANHRFGPVSFVAAAPPGRFGGEPFFGQTRLAAHLLPEGERVLRDNDPVQEPPEAADDAPDAGAKTAPEGPGEDAAAGAPERDAPGEEAWTPGDERDAPEDAPSAGDAPGDVTAAATSEADAPVGAPGAEAAVTSARIDLSASPRVSDAPPPAPVFHDLAEHPLGVSAPEAPEPVDPPVEPGAETAAETGAEPGGEDAPEDRRRPALTAAQIMAKAPPQLADAITPSAPQTATEAGRARVGWRRGAVAAGLAALVAAGVVWSLASGPGAIMPPGASRDDAPPAAQIATPEPEGKERRPETGDPRGQAETPEAAAPEPAPEIVTALPGNGLAAPEADFRGPGPSVSETGAPGGGANLGPLARLAPDGPPRVAPSAPAPGSDAPGRQAATERAETSAPDLVGDGAAEISNPAAGGVEVAARAPDKPAPLTGRGAPEIRLAALDLRVDAGRLVAGGAAAPGAPAGPDAAPARPAPPPTAPSAQAAPEATGDPATATAQPNTGQTEAGQPEAGQTEAGRPDAAQAEARPPTIRPRARPEGLAPAAVASALPPAEALPRPRPRPQARIADLEAEAAAAAAAEAAVSSAAAIAASQTPETRPEDLAPPPRTATAMGPDPEDDGEPDARRAPRIPTSASVAERATVDDGIVMRNVNLIGVFGSSSNRRALVRMPNGDMLRLRVGDRIDGGRVAVIEQSRLIYVKGGQNLILKIPNG